MNGKRKLTVFISTAVLLMGMAGCASVQKKADIVWPLPPEEPKIKFVEVLRSDKDLGKTGVENALFGEESKNSLTRPYGCATDAEGRIYATDVGRVFVFDEKNRKLSFIGDEASTGKLAVPLGIAVSHDGKVYVADSARKRVFVYDSKWDFLTAFGKKGDLESPTGIALDEKRGRLYVANTRKHNVMVYALADGKLLKTIGGRGGDPGKFNYPTNIVLDNEGNIYVTDTGNFRIQVFDPDGKHLRTIGSIGDKPGNFARPKGIALDSEGNLYVVDTEFNNIQVFNKKGDLLIYVGEGGFTPGRFNSPSGICIDDKDRIIVADGMNGRLQVLQYLGEKWKKTHPGEVTWTPPKTEATKPTPKAETAKPKPTK
jgi:DNA-binding beta-propeller fold protein YncE